MNNLSVELERVAAECLDAVVSGRTTIEECLRRHPGFSETLKPMLLTAAELRQMAQTVHPSASFARQAGASLQARLASSSRPPASVRVPQPRRTVWQRVGWHPVTSLPTAIALASLVLSFLQAGIVTAANQALPGEPLYGLDRTLERVSLGLADEESRPQLQLEIAQERLEEADQLEELGRENEANQALDAYQATVDALIDSDPDESVTQMLTDLENQREELQNDIQPEEREQPPSPENANPGDPLEGPSGLDAPGKSGDAQGNPQSFEAPGNWPDAPGQTGDTPSGAENNNAGGNSGNNPDSNNAGGNSKGNNAGGNPDNKGKGNGNGGSGNNGQGNNSDPPESSSSGFESQETASSTSGQNNQSGNNRQPRNQNHPAEQKNNSSSLDR